ncbi:tetraspanin-9-like [Clavelina lepadiformis]|uniref:tetraspanin-9-like n=1 Tax=Clavelina lepadiformis TaxID=159417 RepID=UPI004041D4F9
MESRGLEVCRYLMFVVNLIIFACGIGLLAVGVWVYVGGESFRQLISSDPAIFSSVAIIIAVGCVLIVAGFFGCAGAIRESKCMLGTFFAIMLLLFLVEVVVVILIFVYYPRAKELAITSIESYNTTTKAPWDAIQSTLKCCGYTNVSDWGSNIPPSCCGNTTLCNSKSPTLYNTGCEAVVRSYFWTIGGVGIGVLVFEILSMIFSCCIISGINKYDIA